MASSPTKRPARTERKYPTFKVMTANMLQSVSCMIREKDFGKNSQQVTKSSLESVDTSSREFSTDSPGSGFLASRLCCNDADLLVKAARC